MLLITGASGQLGSELKPYFPKAMFSTRQDFNLTDPTSVQSFVKQNHITEIINCAAYTAVDKAEDEPELCWQINALAPKLLAQTGAKLIHISTDYVFDGKNHKPYQAKDATNPLSIYGKTKLEGEQAALKHARTAIIIRTSWVYSIFGNNFVKTMQRLGQQKEYLSVVADQVGSPTNAADLAKAIAHILPQIKEGQKDVYHYSNEGVASWYDFALEIMQASHLFCTVSPISSCEYPTKAVRPFYSVLEKDKIKKDFDINIPHWKESLHTCIEGSRKK